MTAWQSLTQELDAWKDREMQATFWWRDDDAVAPSKALDAMLNISNAQKAPLAIAVIPNAISPDLSGVLNAHPNVTVVQHGFSHINHAPLGEKSAELGSHRTLKSVLDELSEGQSLLHGFDNTQAILVPPWNRISQTVTEALASIGFQGVSTFTPRKSVFAAPNLVRVNAHVDIIDWRGSRGFAGEDFALREVIEHLQAKRHGASDIIEPTGLLSHHLVHDEDCWVFIDKFLDHLNTHDAARIIPVAEALVP